LGFFSFKSSMQMGLYGPMPGEQGAGKVSALTKGKSIAVMEEWEPGQGVRVEFCGGVGGKRKGHQIKLKNERGTKRRGPGISKKPKKPAGEKSLSYKKEKMAERRYSRLQTRLADKEIINLKKRFKGIMLVAQRMQASQKKKQGGHLKEQ